MRDTHRKLKVASQILRGVNPRTPSYSNTSILGAMPRTRVRGTARRVDQDFLKERKERQKKRSSSNALGLLRHKFGGFILANLV